MRNIDEKAYRVLEEYTKSVCLKRRTRRQDVWIGFMAVEIYKYVNERLGTAPVLDLIQNFRDIMEDRSVLNELTSQFYNVGIDVADDIIFDIRRLL